MRVFALYFAAVIVTVIVTVIVLVWWLATRAERKWRAHKRQNWVKLTIAHSLAGHEIHPHRTILSVIAPNERVAIEELLVYAERVEWP